ncbi:glycosyltransferase [Modicisalibacter sp. 'Wilcox']|uniref:glycosyltransferase n=1 Tax=Modicisalibacter sp. 'Wilcox' TaxID=2679914 RepID=UPI0013D240CD|nr:glycosyltransferase [Modicisalibacter sp. 'Wilcox']
MKILHVNLAKGFRGGERQTLLLIEALAARDDLEQILVCRRDSPLRDRLADASGVSVVTAEHQLAGYGAVGRVDVVHAHEAKAVHWAWLHWCLRRVPYVITRRVDTPVGDRPLNRWSYRHAASRVAISRVIQAQLVARGWGPVERIPSAHSDPVPDPARTRAFRESFAGRGKAGLFLVGHAGALVDRHKGQRVLLEAARRLETRCPDMAFVFLGAGADGEALQAESRDQDNVFWLGFKDNVVDYIAGFDVFAFPSRNEGLGSVLLDVMACEVPVVASRVGGIPDLVTDGETGLLVEAGDAEALAQALARLHDDNALRRELATGGRRRAEAFSPRQMAAAYLACYTRAVRS